VSWECLRETQSAGYMKICFGCILACQYMHRECGVSQYAGCPPYNDCQQVPAELLPDDIPSEQTCRSQPITTCERCPYVKYVVEQALC
jgi:hypothetical protein